MSTLRVNNVTDLGDDAVVTSGVLDTLAVPAGGILQVVSTTKTDTFSTSNTSFTDVTGLSVNITPNYASSKILVIPSVSLSQKISYLSWIRLLRNSTAIFIGDTSGSRTRASAMRFRSDGSSDLNNTMNSFTYLDSPATTSEITYKIQVQNESLGNLFINRSYSSTDAATRTVTASSITVMEVAA